MTEEEFWRSTPRQVGRALKGVEIRRRREYNERIQLAWHTASLTRTSKPPSSVDKMMIPEIPGEPKKAERKRQTLGEMKRALALLTVANGGKIGPKVLLN